MSATIHSLYPRDSRELALRQRIATLESQVEHLVAELDEADRRIVPLSLPEPVWYAFLGWAALWFVAGAAVASFGWPR